MTRLFNGVKKKVNRINPLEAGRQDYQDLLLLCQPTAVRHHELRRGGRGWIWQKAIRRCRKKA